MRTSDFQGKVFPVTGGVKIVKKMELTREEILTEIINKPLPLAEEQAKVVTSEAKHIRVIAGRVRGRLKLSPGDCSTFCCMKVCLQKVLLLLPSLKKLLQA